MATAAAAPAALVEGNMAAPAAAATNVDSLGSADTLYTLNEPITTTFMRDLRRVGKKLKTVLMPMGAEADTLRELRDWDLWGPLLLCLLLSIITSARAPAGQQSLVFAGVFVLVWVGAAVVTLNAKLLGGKMCAAARACRPLPSLLSSPHLPPSFPARQLLFPERVRAGLLRVPLGHRGGAELGLEQRAVEGAARARRLCLVVPRCVERRAPFSRRAARHRPQLAAHLARAPSPLPPLAQPR